MSRFERGLGNPDWDVPPNQEQGDGFESFATGSQQAERRGLSLIAKKGPIASRLREAVWAITVGATLLLGATPSSAQEGHKKSPEEQEIEQKMQKLEEEKRELQRQEQERRYTERKKKLNGWLACFNVKGLELGEAKNMERRTNEQLGVYLKGKYLGNVVSDKELIFSYQEFIDDVTQLLGKNEIKFEFRPPEPQSPEKIDFKIIISPEAQEILDSWGGFSDPKRGVINIGSKTQELNLDSNTKKVEITSVGNDMLIVTCEDFDGTKTIVTCINKEVKDVLVIK